MAQMTAQKHPIGEFNNNTGEEYGTQMSNPQDFTKIVENSVYATDKAESVEGLGLNQPDNTDANVVGTANVEITGTGASKKFKFNNLKGATGSQGIQGKSYNPTGAWSNSTEYINSSTIIDTVQLNGSTYWCKQTHTNQSPTEGTDNAYWGLLALKGSDSSVDILQTTGTSTTSVMSQDAVTTQLGTKFDKTDIVQVSGASVDKVMSQDATTLLVQRSVLGGVNILASNVTIVRNTDTTQNVSLTSSLTKDLDNTKTYKLIGYVQYEGLGIPGGDRFETLYNYTTQICSFSQPVRIKLSDESLTIRYFYITLDYASGDNNANVFLFQSTDRKAGNKFIIEKIIELD